MRLRSALLSVLRVRLAGAALVTTGFFVQSSTAHAVLVSSWTQNAGSSGSGLNTANPVLGNGSSGSANGQQIYATTASQTLAMGDSLKLSGAFTIVGTTAPQADQFRFGLYDVNGQSGVNGWLGYFVTNTGTAAGGTGPTVSNLWERSSGNSGGFGSGAGAVTITTAGATPSNTSFISGNYTFSLNITRVATGLELMWNVVGTDLTYSLSKTFTDTTPLTYTFNRIGVLTGGSVNSDQISFSSIDVAFTSAIPEPASWSVIVSVCALAFCVRRRAVRV